MSSRDWYRLTCLLRNEIIVWYLDLGCCSLLPLLQLASLSDGFVSSLHSLASFSSTSSCCFSLLILYDTASAWMSVFQAEHFWPGGGGTTTSASSDVASWELQLPVVACALPGSVYTSFSSSISDLKDCRRLAGASCRSCSTDVAAAAAAHARSPTEMTSASVACASDSFQSSSL